MTEVAIGQTALTGGTSLTVTVRATEHKTVASGSPGTVVVVGTNLWLAADMHLVNGATGSLPPVFLMTMANGTAATTLTLPAPNALVRLRAWRGPATNNVFASNQVAWASLDYAAGAVVSLTASPDVGDDKNTAVAKRAKLRFTRTGPTTNALTVSFVLPTNGIATPVDLRNLIATYGNSGNGDYTLLSTNASATLVLAAANSGGVNTITIPTGAATAVVDVVVRADSLTEANVVRADLVAASTYAFGTSTRADVYIYDGPEWSLFELRTDNLGTTTETYAYGLNHLNGSIQPRAAGKGTAYTGSGYQSYGGSWLWPTTYYLNPAYDAVYYGISTSPARLVGKQGNNAVSVLPDATGFLTLSNLVVGPSLAWGVSPNATYIAGYSGSTKKPVVWVDFATPINLAQNFSTSDGEALGVNAAGEAVGTLLLDLPDGSPGYRPFRSKAGAADLATDQGDVLPQPPSDVGDTNYNADGSGIANAVNAGGAAVGRFLYNPIKNKRATYWPPRGSSTATNSAGINLKAWNPVWQSPVYTTDNLSEALALNDANWIVGWSGDTATPRAVLKPYLTGAWRDLNDRHWVSGLTGWNLQKATAINNQQIIVGNGIFNGSPRAFMLVPRTQGQ